MHIKHNPLPRAGVISTCMCIYCAKYFIYSSCLLVACNVTVGGKVKNKKYFFHFDTPPHNLILRQLQSKVTKGQAQVK